MDLCDSMKLKASSSRNAGVGGRLLMYLLCPVSCIAAAGGGGEVVRYIGQDNESPGWVCCLGSISGQCTTETLLVSFICK